MVQTHRLTGFNGARLLMLRRQERWSQSELADNLGVRESGLAEPPEGIVNQLVDLCGLPRSLQLGSPYPDFSRGALSEQESSW